MRNPTSSSVSVLCQQPGASSSSEAVKESLTGGQADETKRSFPLCMCVRTHLFMCVTVSVYRCICMHVEGQGH